MTKKNSDIFVKGNELIAYIKSLIHKGSVRRIIIKKINGKKILEISLIAGVGVGGLLLVLHPLLVVIGSVAGWLAEFRIETIQDDDAE